MKNFIKVVSLCSLFSAPAIGDSFAQEQTNDKSDRHYILKRPSNIQARDNSEFENKRREERERRRDDDFNNRNDHRRMPPHREENGERPRPERLEGKGDEKGRFEGRRRFEDRDQKIEKRKEIIGERKDRREENAGNRVENKKEILEARKNFQEEQQGRRENFKEEQQGRRQEFQQERN